MRARLLFTIAGTALLSALLLILLSGGGAAQTDPPTSGDWTVADTTVVTDQTVDLRGDLTVTGTGSLTLRNVTLRVHLSANGERGIEVQTGGRLIIEDGDADPSTTGDASVVTAQPDTRSYHMKVRAGSTLLISNSFVHRCGYTGTVGNTNLGLFVATDDANIEGTVIDDCLHGLVLDHAVITVVDSAIGNCTYHGVNAADSEVTLTGVTMMDNGYEGARIVRGDATFDGCWVEGNRNGLQLRTGANVTINGTTVKGNTDGIRIEIDGNVDITNSFFRNQGQYGVRIENRGRLSITDSQLSGAARSALYAFNDNTITSSGNRYRNNVYGIRLNMDCTLTSTDDSFVSNTNSGVYLESTSDMVIVGGYFIGNSAGVKAEDASTVIAWDTTVEDCSFEGYSITESDLDVRDGSLLNCTGGGIVAPPPSTAQWVVGSGNSSRLLDSDLQLTDYLDITGNTVLLDSTIVFPDGAAPSSFVGVRCSAGNHDWQNMTFRPATSSGGMVFIISGSATGSAWHVTVQNTASNGVPADSPAVSATFEFHVCTFKDSTNGLLVQGPDVVLDRCTFTGNVVGVEVDGEEARFENCTFSSNTDKDVVPAGGGHAVLVNCSFTPSKVVPSGPSDTWSAWWTVHVRVEFPTGGAAAGATVTIGDSKGTNVFTGTANDGGRLWNIMVLEHVTTGTVRDARSPHVFNATLGLSTNEESIDITGPTLVTIEIADGSPPDITVTSHSDGDHIRTPTLVLQGTAYDAGSSVYRVEARIATQAWQTCTGTETWTWTVGLPGDGTYPISVRARDVALNTIIVYLNLTLDTELPTIDVSVPPSPSNNSLVGNADVSVQGWVDADDVVVTAGNITAEMAGAAFTLHLTLVDGLNRIEIRAEDPAGNVAILIWHIQADLDAPALTIISPVNGSSHNVTDLTLTGSTDPFADVYYRVVELSSVWSMLTASGSGGFTKDLTGLRQGVNTIHVMVRDVAGNNVTTTIEVLVDTTPPRLLSTTPINNANLNNPNVTLTGRYNEPLSSISVGGFTGTVDGGNFTVYLTLEREDNQFAVAAIDSLGNVALSTLWLYLDMTPPGLDIPDFTFDPETGNYLPFATNQRSFLLFGNTELGATVYVDRWEYEVDSLGRFATTSLELEEGENDYEVLVRDRAGNEFSTNITLVLDTHAPDLLVTSPEHMSTVSKIYAWVEGTVNEGDTVAVGETEEVSEDGTFRIKVSLDQAVNRIVVTASDDAGNEVSVERVVFRKEDTSGLTGNTVMDENCNAIMVVGVIVVMAIAVLAGIMWKGEDVLDRKEKALESMLEEDHIELDKPHLEPTSGYLQYDPTSETGRKNEFEERDDEEFISMDAFRREMERRE